MSPDQYRGDKKLQLYADLGAALQKSLPQTYALLVSYSFDLSSFNYFLGNQGSMLLMVKRYGDDGGLQVLFTSGDDLLEALVALERALAGNHWRPYTQRPSGAEAKGKGKK